MLRENAKVFVFKSLTEARWAVQTLQRAGFDLDHLSVAARQCSPCNDAICFYERDGRPGYWGKDEDFWIWLFAALDGWAYVVFPSLGAVLVVGPLASWIVAALRDHSIFGRLNALEASLYNMGIPRDSILRYESALQKDKYLVIVHGTADEVDRAQEVLRASAMSLSKN